MTATDVQALRGAVAEMASMLTDGATLRILAMDESAPMVELAVDFPDVTCESASCRGTAARRDRPSVTRRVAPSVTLVLHDPRVTDFPGDGFAGQGAGFTQVVVLDPTGIAPEGGPSDPGPDAGPLRGETVAIRCDVLWDSFDWTLEEWIAELEAAGATVRTWRRVQGQTGAEYDRAQAEYETMLAGADLALSGLANCGSCTSWTIHDTADRRRARLGYGGGGHRAFRPLGRLLAADGGRPGLHVVVLPFPFDTLPEAEVRAHARALFPRLLEVLGATA